MTFEQTRPTCRVLFSIDSEIVCNVLLELCPERSAVAETSFGREVTRTPILCFRAAFFSKEKGTHTDGEHPNLYPTDILATPGKPSSSESRLLQEKVPNVHWHPDQYTYEGLLPGPQQPCGSERFRGLRDGQYFVFWCDRPGLWRGIHRKSKRAYIQQHLFGIRSPGKVYFRVRACSRRSSP